MKCTATSASGSTSRVAALPAETSAANWASIAMPGRVWPAMALFVSLPICTMLTSTPASSNDCRASAVKACSAVTVSASDNPAHAFGTSWRAGSAQKSE